MFKLKKDDEVIELVRNSIVANKTHQRCVKDYSGDVFVLTADMLIKGGYYNKRTAKELSGTAEGILQKYAKLLTVVK